MPDLTRRALLRLLGTGTLGAAVAACSSASNPSQHASTSGSPSSATPSSVLTPSPAASSPNWQALSSRLSGRLLRPGSSDYAAAAPLYNPRYDNAVQPAAIARCASSDDVAACVRFAADNAVPFAVRSGGHSYTGASTSTGLVIDVRPMSQVAVSTTDGQARVGAGAQLVDVYSRLANRGVGLAAGSCPSVGIAGLTLGGGVGVLVRAWGLTSDQLVAAEVVTADGAVRMVDAKHEQDLLWALRGGGGGTFGVVTSLTFATHAAPTVTTFFLRWGFDNAAGVLDAWQTWAPNADRKLWSTCKLLGQPANGSLQVTVSGTWIGPPSALTAQLEPLRTAVGAAPVASQVRSLAYGDAMLLEAGCYGQNVSACLTKALSAPSREPFSATSSILSARMPAEAIDAIVSAVRQGLNVHGMHEGGVSFDALGGAVQDIRPADSAFPYRQALATVQYTATWPPGSPTAPEPFDAFVRGLRSTMRPWLGDAAYVNYADASITDYGAAYWDRNYPRLQQLKKAYDPHGLFTFPQAVRA